MMAKHSNCINFNDDYSIAWKEKSERRKEQELCDGCIKMNSDCYTQILK